MAGERVAWMRQGCCRVVYGRGRERSKGGARKAMVSKVDASIVWRIEAMAQNGGMSRAAIGIQSNVRVVQIAHARRQAARRRMASGQVAQLVGTQDRTRIGFPSLVVVSAVSASAPAEVDPCARWRRSRVAGFVFEWVRT